MLVQIDLRQGLHETPHARTEETAKGVGDDPSHRRMVGGFKFVYTCLIDRMHRHGDQ